MSKLIAALCRSTRLNRRSDDAGSSPAPSRGSSRMDEDEAGAAGLGGGSAVPQARQLLSENDIVLRTDRERSTFNELRLKEFEHTLVFDRDLLRRTGMDEESAEIFHAVGWENFWEINEPGSYLLTLEFLSTLVSENGGIRFRFFNQEFFCSWRDFSLALGFSSRCSLEPSRALKRFDRVAFWKRISGNTNCHAPRMNSIHNPTLRFMHKWVAMTVFPRADIRPVNTVELRILYAMFKKVPVSPVKDMIDHWLSHISRVGSMAMTSLVTRLANHLGVLQDAQCTYIETARSVVDAEHFVQAHILRKLPDASLVMIYRGYTAEVRLPCAALKLYTAKKLMLHLSAESDESPPPREPARHSVAGEGPLTRGRARRDAGLATSQEPEDEQETPHRHTSAFEATYDMYTGAGTSRAGGSGQYQDPNYQASGRWTTTRARTLS